MDGCLEREYMSVDFIDPRFVNSQNIIIRKPEKIKLLGFF